MMKRYAWVAVLAAVMAGAASATKADAAPAAATLTAECNATDNIAGLWATYGFVQDEYPEWGPNQVKAWALPLFKQLHLNGNCGTSYADDMWGGYLWLCSPGENEPWVNWDCMEAVLFYWNY